MLQNLEKIFSLGKIYSSTPHHSYNKEITMIKSTEKKKSTIILRQK